jgi:nitrite reductase/ring-hydroxylating ferredoxin subunit
MEQTRTARHLPIAADSTPQRDAADDLYAHVPSGWFVLAHSKELGKEKLLTRRLAGREIVLFRTASGALSAVDPHCPHMGAHFGHGGCVKGETIACPFHDFRFDRDGKCVATGYGTPPPPRAKAKTHPVIERHGEILVWHGNANEEPSFDVPEVDTEGFMEPLFEEHILRGHPQETSENSVDFGHLGIVHGYQNVKVLRELIPAPGYLSVQYAMDRPFVTGVPGLGKLYAEFFIHVYGLGYSRVEVNVPEYGFRSRHLVYATPIDREQLKLYTGFTFQPFKGPEAIPRIMKRLPLGLANRLIRKVAMEIFVHDVKQDFAIWKNKRYVHPPQLAQGDGPVGAYRRWCKQFYPSLQQAPAPAADS